MTPTTRARRAVATERHDDRADEAAGERGIEHGDHARHRRQPVARFREHADVARGSSAVRLEDAVRLVGGRRREVGRDESARSRGTRGGSGPSPGGHGTPRAGAHDPAQGREAHEQVEGEDRDDDAEELRSAAAALVDEAERDERRREQRQEHAAAGEHLVVDERPRREQAPVLGAQDRDHPRVAEVGRRSREQGRPARAPPPSRGWLDRTFHGGSTSCPRRSTRRRCDDDGGPRNGPRRGGRQLLARIRSMTSAASSAASIVSSITV